ncbi:hypothetical protein H257_07717 [Aphanomyces astaci]|uniref:DUF6818 domain-containing protein n=1 Tax=Aphanomyces astaci TaxID=112090 RepID=W4GGX0_APHAT|nr:hypothetical protein H257_07717 [Aphanomyces astaci]ETV78927.1 hypothetical protein H257_07717 [Aphanomyces astaci]|eukprot:XP_009831646.1 hypothetical protein H257_07717 [Aphanomyces astaci]
MSMSSNGREKNWCVASVDLMLDKVESILPMGKNAWRKVEVEFNTAASVFPHRDAESLKCKYQQLRNNPKPTSDPECPMDVRRAKRIARDIDNKTDVLAREDDCEVDDEVGSIGNGQNNQTKPSYAAKTEFEARQPDRTPNFQTHPELVQGNPCTYKE